MSIGQKLKTLRGSQSQNAIAKQIGITVSAWAMYERDERIPRDEVKVKIARHFKKTVQEIFFDNVEHK